jgi:hypothetical protein
MTSIEYRADAAVPADTIPAAAGLGAGDGTHFMDCPDLNAAARGADTYFIV